MGGAHGLLCARSCPENDVACRPHHTVGTCAAAERKRPIPCLEQQSCRAPTDTLHVHLHYSFKLRERSPDINAVPRVLLLTPVSPQPGTQSSCECNSCLTLSCIVILRPPVPAAWPCLRPSGPTPTRAC